MTYLQKIGTDRARITRLTAAGTTNRLGANIIVPAQPAALPPLLVLHGISRNASELTGLFRSEAESCGRMVIVPHFDAANWRFFQRPGRAARPDHALLALLSAVALEHPQFAGPVSLFGHSGGAQLAHRFAMLYPQKVADLHLAAAGWYCLPDRSMAWPCGLAESGDSRDDIWLRRSRAGLTAFLDRTFHIYVGSRDTDRDKTLRQTPELDRIQGRTRLARARLYAATLEQAAQAAGLRPRVALHELAGCGHDVAWAIRHAGLARRVCANAAAEIPPVKITA
ncbi:Pimeloyl-ACP methyl ester carboxylesterase [Paracoccus isoporae]|uniref:Pimeloyl-ACP methyl ester carboxylesterase n=1 Tax=Paracoccus isoporae TaxID=591205 RepID=A0A1G6ZM43_9RHOB|nr:alpha/beta hydrolase [Paracoccus isoporae]SDE03894.1 Pimeloyl-ACP methyl ester carboxylesterase [Paracoccus isoporae]